MGETLVGDPVAGRFLSHGPAANGKLLVDGDRVAAWYLPLAEIGPADWLLLESLLIPAERARAARFHFERDRLVYIAAHALVRGLLSFCTGHPARDWRFAVEAHGKPELSVPAGAPRLRVNLSHTRGLAAAALTIDHDIGVDVEWLARTVETATLAMRVLSEAERRVLAAAPPAERVETFLTFWTLKEAYVKAIGKGLSQPLEAFSFDLDRLTIRFDDEAGDDAAHWRFDARRPSADHRMALAVRHPDPSRLDVDVGPAPLAYLRGLAV
ncbi:4'-phosphopantetheinyl transferase superfamily protein [Aurantimonas aggregata]|uniref:4'-phosphopantetheinyl transferase superfamily protein n=1 Tax=Aurantimonas aggregata TaxID=2047720 RepID=A0A6L9MCH9_9HYPH|nr:4'-phosphopantetheinyl transferase superfamily protein [Aurantimonas aggregata]NDV85386.1 4'-phosphopantetheinyl transferase superfamily protein [Aurantimonas aggregata]